MSGVFSSARSRSTFTVIPYCRSVSSMSTSLCFKLDPVYKENPPDTSAKRVIRRLVRWLVFQRAGWRGAAGDESVTHLRKRGATRRRGELVTLPNVGSQLFGVVTLSDASAGVSGQVHRMRGMVETHDTTKHPLVNEQRVDLGAR